LALAANKLDGGSIEFIDENGGGSGVERYPATEL